MNFEAAVKYLKSFRAYDEELKVEYNEKNFDLVRIKDFLKAYKIDDSKVKYIHVAGSKGKGSVCSMIERYIRAKGLKTGLFLSPYMVKITESFYLNGKEMPPKKFVSYVKDLKKFIEVQGGTSLTSFELMVVMAIKYFSDEKVDYAVIEVAMGGRLDATNVISPKLAVLTSIELEHTDVFGKSLKRIVYEKCGIVINEVPVVVAPQNNLVRKLIKTELKGRKSKMFFTDEISIPKINVDFENLVHEDNAKVVYLSLKTLLNEVDMKVFKNVLSVFKFEGRFDVRKVNGKTVVFDIAHTENSMRNLVNSLAKKFPKKDFLFLFSVMIGKNVSAMLDEILKISDEIVFTRSHKIRGYEAKELFGKYSKIFQKSSFMEDPFMAYASLLKKVSKNRILVVTGSHFLVGKIFSKIK